MVKQTPKGLKKRGRPWWLVAFRASGAAVLSLWVLYVVAANVFLAGVYDRIINGDPDSVDIHLASGWTIFPGRVHAKGISIRGRDSSIEWMLRIDAVEFDVSLIGLTRKHFFVSRVRANGVSFRLRRNLDAPPTSPAQVADHPPIEGFPLGYWLRPTVPSLDLWSDADWHLWTIRLEGVFAKDVREVWIDSKRFEGGMSINGRFYLKPLRAVDVGPAIALIDYGQLREGPRTWVDQVGGRIDAEVEPFDPRRTRGVAMLHQVNVDAAIRARVPDLAIVPPLWGATATGRIDARQLVLKVKRGVVQEGSSGEIGPNAVTVVAEGHSITGELAGTFRTVRADGHTQLLLRVHAADAWVSRSNSATEGLQRLVHVQHLIALADSTELDLPRLCRDLHGTLDLSNVELSDARVFNAYIPRTTHVEIRNGRAACDAEVEFWTAEKRAAGHARVRADDLDLSLANGRVRAASLTASARIHNATSGSEEVVLDEATVELKNLTAFHRNVGALGSVNLAANQATLAVRMRADLASHVARGEAVVHAHGLGIATKKFHVRGNAGLKVNVVDFMMRKNTMRVLDSQAVMTQITGGFGTQGAREFSGDRVELRATSPAFDRAHPKLASVDLRLIVDRAILADVRALKALLPSAPFVAESGAVALSADLKVSGSRGTASGGVNVSLARVGFSLHETRIDGDYLFAAQIRGFDRGTRSVDISGSTFQMRNVAVSHASAKTTGWRGDLVLDRAVLRLDDEPGLDAALRLVARDATPFLALALRYDLPKPFVAYTHMPRLDASARVSVEPGQVSIRDLAAAGGDLRLSGLYSSRGAHRRGAFVIGLGPLSAGLRLDDAGTHLRFFGLDGWMRSESVAVASILTPRVAARLK